MGRAMALWGCLFWAGPLRTGRSSSHATGRRACCPDSTASSSSGRVSTRLLHIHAYERFFCLTAATQQACPRMGHQCAMCHRKVHSSFKLERFQSEATSLACEGVSAKHVHKAKRTTGKHIKGVGSLPAVGQRGNRVAANMGQLLHCLLQPLPHLPQLLPVFRLHSPMPV